MRVALIAYDCCEPEWDEHGQPVTRWDGVSFKPSPVTGENVPDESRRLPQYRYVQRRPAQWPEADYVVGNPPFIGAATMRRVLGDGYVDAAILILTHFHQPIGATKQETPTACG